MTPQTRLPDRHDRGPGSRVGGGTGMGAAGAGAGDGAWPVGADAELVGARAGLVGADPTATAAATRLGLVGGVPPGLVQRVQRRLVATGTVASDVAGLRAAVADALGEDGVQLPAPDLAAVVRSIGDELTGLGPLAPLLADPLVTDVMVNGPTEVWVERAGAIERAAVRFASAAAVAALVQRVVAPLGLRVDESRPWVDARLPGGERFHAVLPRSPPTVPSLPSAASPGDGSSSAT